MAHFAKLDQDNNVLWVTPLQDSICQDNEQKGIDYLTKVHNWPLWKKTSYNTINGTHLTGGTPFRANFAGPGYVYDPNLDIFKKKNKPIESWTLNVITGKYEAPVAYPSRITEDENDPNWELYYNIKYKWNETNQNWELR